MKKLGRNDPCPCGSGKKYKKCHGFLKDSQLPAQRNNQDKVAGMTINLSDLGLSGQLQYIYSIPQFKDPKDSRNVGGPQGLPGKYKIVFVLSRPGIPIHPEYNYSFESGLKGNSHLAISKPAFSPPSLPDANKILIRASTQDGNFKFSGMPNEKGFLGKIILDSIDANNYEDAHIKAYRVLAPTLSNWSAHLDIPLNVHQFEITELRTGGVRMSIVTPFFESSFNFVPESEATPSYRGYASLYREALNSNSYAYQYLCFFKIMESILGRRTRLEREAKRKMQSHITPNESFPNHKNEYEEWLNSIFPRRPLTWDAMTFDSIFKKEVIGKGFKEVINNYLNPLRVKIAHALLGASGELTMSVDETLHLHEVNFWLPIIKCMVRKMLKNEFPKEYLIYLDEKGEIKTPSPNC
jgi:hypothetical protein